MKVRCCALILRDDSVLVLKYQYPRGTVFALPGGTQECGETLEDTLKRELQEEMGVAICVNRLLMVGDSPRNDVLAQAVHIVFSAVIDQGIPGVNPEHTSAEEAVWLPIHEIPDTMLYPSINRLVTGFAQDPHLATQYSSNCMQRRWS